MKTAATLTYTTAAYFALYPDDEDQFRLSVELLYDPSREPAEG